MTEPDKAALADRIETHLRADITGGYILSEDEQRMIIAALRSADGMREIAGLVREWRMREIEGLVREWREAQKAIDRMTGEQRRYNKEPLDRLIAAHNALVKYADEEMG